MLMKSRKMPLREDSLLNLPSAGAMSMNLAIEWQTQLKKLRKYDEQGNCLN